MTSNKDNASTHLWLYNRIKTKWLTHWLTDDICLFFEFPEWTSEEWVLKKKFSLISQHSFVFFYYSIPSADGGCTIEYIQRKGTRFRVYVIYRRSVCLIHKRFSGNNAYVECTINLSIKILMHFFFLCCIVNNNHQQQQIEDSKWHDRLLVLSLFFTSLAFPLPFFPSNLFSSVLHLASYHNTYMAICVAALVRKNELRARAR